MRPMKAHRGAGPGDCTFSGLGQAGIYLVSVRAGGGRMSRKVILD
jgi:hypothetical protein